MNLSEFPHTAAFMFQKTLAATVVHIADIVKRTETNIYEAIQKNNVLKTIVHYILYQ
ncbi:MAG: hypothetical protein V4556_13120 [Bacteroidota bacterium]